MLCLLGGAFGILWPRRVVPLLTICTGRPSVDYCDRRCRPLRAATVGIVFGYTGLKASRLDPMTRATNDSFAGAYG